MTRVTLCTCPLLSLACRGFPADIRHLVLESGITWSPEHPLPRNPKVLPISERDLQSSNHDKHGPGGEAKGISPSHQVCLHQSITTIHPSKVFHTELLIPGSSPSLSSRLCDPALTIRGGGSTLELCQALGTRGEPTLAAGGTASMSAKGLLPTKSVRKSSPDRMMSLKAFDSIPRRHCQL